jgi:hypothetical protein
MYVETMTTEEMMKEFQKAYDKIEEVAYRIMSRSKLIKGKEVDLGTRKLTINGTEYFYILSAKKAKKKYCGENIVSTTIIPYTIQTHNDNGNRFVIMFDLSTGNKLIREIEYHVFVRYRQRFLSNNTKLSLDNYCIREFLKRNKDGMLKMDNETKEVIRVVPDGLMLGEMIDPQFHKFRTFIIEEQLRKDQMLWSKYGELWKAWENYTNACNNDPQVVFGNRDMNSSIDEGRQLMKDLFK